MATILLQNGDDQGVNAARHFQQVAPGVTRIRVEFQPDGRITAGTFAAARQWAAANPGPNTVVWAGHGRGPETHAHVGHPMTNINNVRANLLDVLALIASLNPETIYFATCRAMRWVQRERATFERELRFINSRIRVFAPEPKIPGYAFRAVAQHITAGAPAPAAFDTPLFQECRIFGETFYEWRNRVDAGVNTTAGGAREAPF